MRTSPRSLVLVVAAAVVAGGPRAAAGEDEQPGTVDVRDLLPRGHVLRGPTMHPWPDPRGEMSVEDEAEPVLYGVDADGLVELVAAVAGVDDLTLAPDGHTLRTKFSKSVREAVQRIRDQRVAAVDVDLAIERADGAGWTTVLSAREPVVPGVWVSAADVESKSGLHDFDVEIAQSAQIPDPIVGFSQAGAAARFVVLPLPGGTDALLECDATVATRVPYAALKPGYQDMADMDRIAVRVERAAMPLRIRSGVPTIVEWTGAGGAAMRLRVTATWRQPPRDPAGRVTMLWTPAVNWNLDEWWHDPIPVQNARAEEDEAFPVFGRHAEVPGLRLADVRETWTEPFGLDSGTCTASGLLALTGERSGEARDAVIAGCDATCRRVDLRVDAWSVPKGAAGPGAPGAVALVTGSAPGLVLGTNALFTVGDGTSYLQDYDVEVAQSARVPDPIVGRLMTGAYANVRPEPGADGAVASFVVGLSLSRIESWDTQTVEQLVPLGAPSTIVDTVVTEPGKPPKRVSTEGTGDASALLRTSYTIEKPVVRHSRISVRLPAGPDGSATLRRALPGYLGADRELLLVVRAR